MNFSYSIHDPSVRIQSSTRPATSQGVEGKSERDQTCLDVLEAGSKTVQHIEIYGPAAARATAAGEILKAVPAGAASVETEEGGRGVAFGRGAYAAAHGSNAQAESYGEGAYSAANNSAEHGRAKAVAMGKSSWSVANNLGDCGSAAAISDREGSFTVANSEGLGAHAQSISVAAHSRTFAKARGDGADVQVRNAGEARLSGTAGAHEHIRVEGDGESRHTWQLTPGTSAEHPLVALERFDPPDQAGSARLSQAGWNLARP